MTLTTEQRLELLDHAMWVHNAGINTEDVLKLADKLAAWCEPTTTGRLTALRLASEDAHSLYEFAGGTTTRG